MRRLKSALSIVALSVLALCFGTSEPAHAFTHAVAVTVDEDGTPFILDSSGSVWGYLRPDELLEPIKLPNLSHIKQIVPFAALTLNGHVFTWDYDSPACPVATPPDNGDEYYGEPELRDEAYSVPHEVPGLNNVVSISGMARHFLALRRDGSVVEFGKKLSILPSALDQCAALSSAELMPKLDVVSSITNAIAVATDGTSNGVLERNGFFYGWGRVLLDKNWREESRGLNWTNQTKIFVGTDKTSIAINGFLVALSRNKRAYYWGVCETSVPHSNDIVLAGDADSITEIGKISLSPNQDERNAYVLSNGKVVLLYPPGTTSLNAGCTLAILSSRKEPEVVSQMPVKATDAALPIGLGVEDSWLLMVGADGSLWKIKILLAGGFTDLTNVNLP